MALAKPHVTTASDFRQLLRKSDNSGSLLELIHGEVIEKVPTEAHGKLAALIAHFLLAFILPRGIKAHVGVEVRHEAPGDQYNSRLPDVSLRLSDAPPVDSGAVAQMPDLAVEIQSPADRPHQMREKALYYLQKNTRLVWLVYIADQRVEVCTLDDGGNLNIVTATMDDTLDGGAVLPEFTLPVRALFPDA